MILVKKLFRLFTSSLPFFVSICRAQKKEKKILKEIHTYDNAMYNHPHTEVNWSIVTYSGNGYFLSLFPPAPSHAPFKRLKKKGVCVCIYQNHPGNNPRQHISKGNTGNNNERR